MSSLSDRIFRGTILADVCLIIGYVFSALSPEYRLWPIGDSSRRWWFNWSALSVLFTGFPALTYYDRDTFVFTDRRSTVLGGILSTVGLIFSLTALFELGWTESSGREGNLRTGGLYRYTRNPQSVGVIPAIVGGILLSNSRRLLVHGLLTIVIYALFPFAEEPWLEEQYGEAYERYCERTPRFVG